MDAERFVSGSEFKTFRRCRRKWMIEYVWHVTLPKGNPGALEIGSLTHEGLQVITEGGTIDEARKVIYNTMLESLPSDPLVHGEWFDAAADSQNYIVGYVEWLEETGSDQRYKTYAAEEEVTMPLTETATQPWTLRGKLDRRMYDRFTDRHVFMDFKTCRNFDDIMEAAYRNEQFPTYEMLMRYKYPDERCGSGVWRMLKKVKRARDGDGEYFKDHPSTFNDAQMEAVRVRYVAMAHEMSQLEEEIAEGKLDNAYPSPDFRCSWDCPYKHECPMFDDGSRVQDAIRTQYVSFDPYARYERKGNADG